MKQENMTPIAQTPALPADADLADIGGLVHSLLARISTAAGTLQDPATAARLVALGHACHMFQDAQQTPSFTNGGLVDRTVFDKLMHLAGPDTAVDLLDRLAEDLLSVRTLLLANAGQHMVRAQSHILIGLAGAVGADYLQTLAQHLNDAANTTDTASCCAIIARLTPPLDALIAFVRQQRAEPAGLA